MSEADKLTSEEREAYKRLRKAIENGARGPETVMLLDAVDRLAPPPKPTMAELPGLWRAEADKRPQPHGSWATALRKVADELEAALARERLRVVSDEELAKSWENAASEHPESRWATALWQCARELRARGDGRG